MTKAKNIDEYIAMFPVPVQELLEELRTTIKTAAPEAQEVISYGMPAFKTKSVLVYFAAYKNHIGFYPTSSGIAAFIEELAGYKVSKGTVQLPLDQPLPLALITKIVQFRVTENTKKQLIL
jgi:uncharacterized protein YdhG (YjbR/CyaY superfamily)